MNNDGQFWQIPSAHPRLGEQEVHVWRASLEQLSEGIEPFQRQLSDEEAERAKRFYFVKDRRYWTVARAVLRLLLGRYLAVDPRQVRFTNNEYGKPALLFPPEGQRLHFNLSHSGGLALYAFAYEREVGVDVEQMRGQIDYESLSTHYFSAVECASLQSVPAATREEAFFLCWSRKEAYIKARGKGLSLPLDQFDVSLVPGEPAKLLGSREEPLVTERWLLNALFPGPGYAGALVVEGSGWQMSGWEWLK